jgi:hypothetical protein
MSTHAQVWTKVNAPVDRGAALLVSALSAFSKLQTLESCEGTNGWAWVTFIYGEQHWKQPWEHLSKFVLGFLGPALTNELGDRVRVSICVTEAGLYRAEMAVRTEAIPATIEVLGKLGSGFTD